MERKDICENCKHFSEFPFGGRGECRIRAPRNDFPVVRTEDWCGEFFKKIKGEGDEPWEE